MAFFRLFKKPTELRDAPALKEPHKGDHKEVCVNFSVWGWIRHDCSLSIGLLPSTGINYAKSNRWVGFCTGSRDPDLRHIAQ
jgi:hypothetical protein